VRNTNQGPRLDHAGFAQQGLKCYRLAEFQGENGREKLVFPTAGEEDRRTDSKGSSSSSASSVKVFANGTNPGKAWRRKSKKELEMVPRLEALYAKKLTQQPSRLKKLLLLHDEDSAESDDDGYARGKAGDYTIKDLRGAPGFRCHEVE
jgi:hypothetical protein